ncbi:type II toxin-antitoxin system RelE/ParE family toxin [Nostoc sp. 2RC]|uniref:type II toxin-antitoxin system RelE family toxin n=1 Tax=Nostoc sp. 2RC TaxID=2485484 RepID=UPI00162AF03E|nr:hypothetical protein [Nostoc sp. 2RC]MBC1235828.1 hypothetical protein [Nostoc sp. 2RC]
MNSSIEYNNQQLKRNRVVLLDKAQIAFDTLQPQDKENIICVINCLEEFPFCSSVQAHKLRDVPNYFMAREGIYRIIFRFQPGEVTIVDIVNHDRLEILYGSLKESEK